MAVSLIDSVQHSEMNASYPEFSSSALFIENFHKYHPVHRLTSWVHYMYGFIGVNITEDDVSVLRKMFEREAMVDLPGRFPKFLLRQSSFASKSCQVMYKKVDATDLTQVISVIKTGYTIHWDNAQEQWKRESITNPDLFTNLVGLWPPTLNCIHFETYFMLMLQIFPRII